MAGWPERHRWLPAAVSLVLLALATVAVIQLSRPAEARLAWSQVQAGGIPNGATLTSLSCPAVDECWAAGTAPAGAGAGLLAHLRDGAWTVVRDTGVRDLDQATSVSCRAVDDCWAASPARATTGVWHYDGTQWTLVEPELDEGQRALIPAGAMSCRPGGTCVATTGGGTGCESRPSVWDGSRWHPTPASAPEPCLRTVDCASVDRCDGFGLSTDTTPRPVVFRIDNDRWIPTTEQARRDYLHTSATSTCPAANSCAVLYSAALNRYRPWAEVGLLDGRTWRDPVAVNAGLPEQLYANGIACGSLTHCLLVGADTDPATGAFRATVYQWDGTQWTVSPLPSFGDGSILTAVACASTNACWALGTDSANDPLLLRALPL